MSEGEWDHTYSILGDVCMNVFKVSSAVAISTAPAIAAGGAGALITAPATIVAGASLGLGFGFKALSHRDTGWSWETFSKSAADVSIDMMLP